MNFRSEAVDVRACDDIREEPQVYIQSQYSQSLTIAKLLDNFRNEILPDADINAFVQNVMQLDTAVGKGLDILGRIVGSERTISYKDSTYTLSDENYRALLKYKALANITDTSLATLNKMMSILFPEDNISVYVILYGEEEAGTKFNDYPMHVRWLTDKQLTEEELVLFAVGGRLTLNAGVGWEFMAIDTSTVFGFLGSDLQPFNQGRFFDAEKEIMKE